LNKKVFDLRILLAESSVAISFSFVAPENSLSDFMSGFACLSLNTHLDLNMSDIIVSSHTIQL
jgi:hypothetical protein